MHLGKRIFKGSAPSGNRDSGQGELFGQKMKVRALPLHAIRNFLEGFYLLLDHLLGGRLGRGDRDGVGRLNLEVFDLELRNKVVSVGVDLLRSAVGFPD